MKTEVHGGEGGGVLPYNHAQKIHSRALDWLQRVEVIRHKLEPVPQGLRHHTRRRVSCLVDDLRQILHDKLDARARRLSNGDRAVAHPARDVDHHSVRRQTGPVKPPGDVVVGQQRITRHVRHESGKDTAHDRVARLEVLEHRQVRLAVVVRHGRAVWLAPAVAPVLERLDLFRRVGEGAFGHEADVRADAVVGREEP